MINFVAAYKEAEQRRKAAENELKALLPVINDIKQRISIEEQNIEAILLEMTDMGVMADICPQTEDRLYVKANPPSVQLLCPVEDLPPAYQRVKIEADKKKIAEDINAGQKFNFAKLQSSGVSLVFHAKRD